jgi:hypothetical protein
MVSGKRAGIKKDQGPLILSSQFRQMVRRDWVSLCIKMDCLYGGQRGHSEFRNCRAKDHTRFLSRGR